MSQGQKSWSRVKIREDKGVDLILDGSEDIPPHPAPLPRGGPGTQTSTETRGSHPTPQHLHRGFRPPPWPPNTPIHMGNSSSQPQDNGETPAQAVSHVPGDCPLARDCRATLFATRWGPKIGNVNMPPGTWRGRVLSGLALGTLV